MAIVTESLNVSVQYDDSRMPDPKNAFANIYNRPPKVKDQSWVPGPGQTENDRPLIDNPETKKAFLKRKVGEYILAVMKQARIAEKYPLMSSGVESDATTASIV